jgi:hypothetical protein
MTLNKKNADAKTILYDLWKSGKEGQYSYAFGDEDSQSAMLKTFKFVADNSKVEWRVDRYFEDGNTYYSIGTNLKTPKYAMTPEMIGLFSTNSVAFIHSHWGVPRNWELGSMGWNATLNRINRSNGNNDAILKTDYSIYQALYYYTYFPNSGNVWEVRNNQIPAFIRNVDNYKRFFWGTLNTW